ncbi:DUF58 domain-containing protein [Nitriliruptoraceae bacterium ZYF776]|nr:DUF58 domain-containing protein [Profundirhabdus halotolerans]
MHPRPAARRRGRDHRARWRRGRAVRRGRVADPLRAGPGVHPAAPRRRAQPRDAEDPVGAARGDGRAARHRRRHDPRPPATLLRHGDPEPDRDGGHLPAARGPARPVPRQGAGADPDRRRARRDPRPHHRYRRGDRRPGGDHRRPARRDPARARGADGLPRAAPRRGAGRGDPPRPRGGPRSGAALRRQRRVAARRAVAGAVRQGPGPVRRAAPGLRRGRPRRGPQLPAPPSRARLRGARRRHHLRRRGRRGPRRRAGAAAAGQGRGVSLAPTSSPLPPELVAQLARHQLVPRRRVRGRFVGAHRSERLGPSIEFADVREYVPGDDPRRVDLAASRRHGRLQVTLTEAENDAAAQVVVDRSASMFGRKQAQADRLTAGLAVLGARDGVRLWLVATDVVGGGWARGAGALSAATVLLDATPVPTDTSAGPLGRPDLAATVRRAARSSATGPLVLVSDLLFDGWELVVDALGAARRDALVLQVLDRDELAPALDDDVRLVDVETGAEVEVGGDDRTAEAYAAALHAHLDAVEAACTRVGAAHRLVPADGDVADVLLRELPATGLVR